MNSDTDSHETAICKDILSQFGPIDQLLGSVSYNDTDSGEGKAQPLRASARVFKKMKFEQIVTAMDKEKKEEIKIEDPIKQENKRTVNPLWGSEEKNIFFEALNEFGKDFENIHLYMSTRLKKRGLQDDAIKTKHQIRHFYYKISHMLLRYLKLSDKVPKPVQELYIMVNYGEMRRKIGSVSKKSWPKLNELINNGSVAVRIKGKTIRIKTPMCRALRRINQLDEKYDDLKLPTRVMVELKPKDMASFLKVQSAAQNPRIKMSLPLQKRLSSLITCVSNRWKGTEALLYDKALISTNVTTKDCVPDQKTIDYNSMLLTSLLRLTPPEGASVELPSIDISEYFTGQSICLTAFEARRNAKLKNADGIKKEEKESAETTFGKFDRSSKLLNDDVQEVNPFVFATKVVDEAPNTILPLKTPDTQIKCDIIEDAPTDVNDVLKEERRVKVEAVRQGWTSHNCASLTIGELYLMFGSDSKLLLEYKWDNPETDSQEVESADNKQENVLSQSLRKLVSLAKLHCNKSAVKCTCGHVCGTKNNVQFKRPMPAKVLKKTLVTQENVVEENICDSDTSTYISVPPKVHVQTDDRLQLPSSARADLFPQLDSMQKLNPRNRRRPRTQQLVVERKLVPNQSDTKHQIVSMDIIQQETESASEDETVQLFSVEPVALLPTLQSNNNNNKPIQEESEKEFTGLLADNPSNSELSTGLSKILKEHDTQWNDVGDYSLSSLLGHLDCQTKTNQSSVSIATDDTQLSHDVDAQVRTLLIESSVDYTAKFADLAAQVVDNKK